MNNYPRSALFQGVPPNAVMVISTLKSTVPLLEEMRKALRGRWWTLLVVERNLVVMSVWWEFDFVSNVQKMSFFRDDSRQDWEMTWTWSRGGPGELISFKKRRLIGNDLWRKQLERDVGPKSLSELFDFLEKKTRLISSTCPMSMFEAAFLIWTSPWRLLSWSPWRGDHWCW